MKWAKHLLKIQNLSEVTNHVLYIYPRDLASSSPGNSSVRMTDEGVSISGLNPLAVREAEGIYLYAIPKSIVGEKSRAPSESWFTNDVPGIVRCKVPIDPIRAVPKSASNKPFVDVYIIEGLPKTLKMHPAPGNKKKTASNPAGMDVGTRNTLLLTASLALGTLTFRTRASMRRKA